jgi:hypothetical protein
LNSLSYHIIFSVFEFFLWTLNKIFEICCRNFWPQSGQFEFWYFSLTTASRKDWSLSKHFYSLNFTLQIHIHSWIWCSLLNMLFIVCIYYVGQDLFFKHSICWQQCQLMKMWNFPW